MPTTLSQTTSIPLVNIRSVCTLQSGSTPPVVTTAAVDHRPAITLTAGTAAGQVNACISESFSITSGTPLTINVSSALDPLGNAAGMVHVTSVIVENDSVTSGHDMVIGAGTHPVFGTDQYTAYAKGGVAAVVNPVGFPVVGGTSDTIT